MGLFDNFPYTNFHELNLDWVLKVLKDIETTIDQFVSLNIIKYADPIQWDITRQYPKNTIVIEPMTGTAYISVNNVPQGVPLSNTDYWSVVFDLGRFITLASQNFAVSYEPVLTTTATIPTVEGGWIVWNSLLYEALNDIHVGDRYVEDANIKKTPVEVFFNRLKATLNTEILDRIAADNALDGRIDQEILDRQAANTALGGRIDQEILDRQAADTAMNNALSGRIDQEILDRIAADNALDGRIDQEIFDRQAADTTLGGRIDQEILDRQATDTALNQRIDNLSGYKDGFKNIKDYGAVGDGELHPLSEFYNSLDAARVDFPFAQSLTLSIDIAALQKAINNNYLVFIPKGIYIFNSSVVLPQNVSVTIQGEDKQHTVFKSVVSSISMIAFERVSGPSLFTLRDIQFVCEAGVTGVTAIYFHGLIDGSIRYEDNWITVQRCNFYDINRAMDLYTCSNIYVDHCYSVRTTIFAYLGRAASFAHFSHILTLLGWCTIYCEDALADGISNGLYCYDVIGVFNSNLTFRVHGWQAVYIQNCSSDFQDGTDGGYFIYGCQDVTINGCWCAGRDIANSHGIRLWNCYNAHISDCTIEHFTSGLRIDAPAYCGNTISNNVFLANSLVDVGVHSGSGVVITGNTFRSGSTPIYGYDNTSHNIADNNVMIGTAYPMNLGDGSLVDRNVYI